MIFTGRIFFWSFSTKMSPKWGLSSFIKNFLIFFCIKLQVWRVKIYLSELFKKNLVLRFLGQQVHNVVVMCSGYVARWCSGYHSTKPKLRFCAGSNPDHAMSEICDGADLWQWPQLQIKLNAFRWSTIPQKQFILINYQWAQNELFQLLLKISAENFSDFFWHEGTVAWRLKFYLNYFLGKNVRRFWAKRAPKWDQDEVYQVLRKINAQDSSNFLHEVATAKRVKVELTYFYKILVLGFMGTKTPPKWPEKGFLSLVGIWSICF